jgi:hypothetical protein
MAGAISTVLMVLNCRVTNKGSIADFLFFFCEGN